LFMKSGSMSSLNKGAQHGTAWEGGVVVVVDSGVEV
jgi:hypothetical protein